MYVRIIWLHSFCKFLVSLWTLHLIPMGSILGVCVAVLLIRSMAVSCIQVSTVTGALTTDFVRNGFPESDSLLRAV